MSTAAKPCTHRFAPLVLFGRCLDCGQLQWSPKGQERTETAQPAKSDSEPSPFSEPTGDATATAARPACECGVELPPGAKESACWLPGGSPPSESHFDPDPRPLCPDPLLGTREGWAWCASCCAIREPNHRCYR